MGKHYINRTVWVAAILLIVELGTYAQSGTVFQKMYREKRTDDCRDFQPTSDGYLLAGLSTSFTTNGDSDIYIQKMNTEGVEQWQKSIGGSGQELACSIYPTSDGNYILAGSTTSKGSGSYDAYLVKISPSGDLIWDKTYGGSGIDQAREAYPTSDGGFIVAGYTTSGSSQMWMFKVDASGNQQWSKTFGGANSDYAYSVKPTTDGGYILLGSTFSYGSAGDFWLIKTNASGDSLWGRVFGGAQNEEGQFVIQDSDGGFVMVGDQQSSSAGDYDVSVRKFDGSGNSVWSRLYGGAGKDVVKMIQKTSDGGFVVAAISRELNANPDMWMIKLDGQGNQQWSKLFGGKEHEHCYAAKQTSDGGYLIAGHTDSAPSIGIDVFLVKTDATGLSAPTITPVTATNANLVMKNYLYVYPNPVKDQLHISLDAPLGNCQLKISNTLGQTVATKEIAAMDQPQDIMVETTALDKGIYFLQIQNKEESLYSQKIIVQ